MAFRSTRILGYRVLAKDKITPMHKTLDDIGRSAANAPRPTT
jgi:hypothetical protein